MGKHLIGTVLIAALTGMGLGQKPPQPGPGPVQAEFLSNLDVHRLDIGKSIFARVTEDWRGPDCVLRKGAVLEGKAEQVAPRVGRNESKLALSFSLAQCNGRDMQPMELFLTVIAQAPIEGSDMFPTNFNLTLSFREQNSLDNTLSSITMTNLELSGIEHRFPPRNNVRPGDVIGLKGLKLDIGTGPNRSTVISSKGRDVYLSQFTQILLAPPALAFRSSSTSASAADPAQPRAGDVSSRPLPLVPPPIPQFNDIEVCAPPGCAVDLPVTAQELKGHTAGSIATRGLGYKRPTDKLLARFADDESLVWLAPGQLLFAFNPRQLIRRNRANQDTTARVIRAVLLDTETRNVIRAVDWEISDAHRYLWQLDGDRILVHVGNELRVYGAGLETEHSIPLAGPLMFVRIAPGGGLMAIATLRERHSPELHARLRSELGTEPQEDVDVTILDKGFNTVAQLSTVSNLMPPTLLNEGQVKLQVEPGQWYRLAMSTWENRRSVLARFRSFCTPQVTSTAPDLLFLETCSVEDGKTVYSVLRPDGKILLRGVSDPQELGHEALGNQRSRTFAVKLVHSQRSIFSDTIFQTSDLDSEEVRVYRVEDGKRLLAVRIKEPVASHGDYAFSPDGSQLAVLSGSDIQFFPVPAQ